MSNNRRPPIDASDSSEPTDTAPQDNNESGQNADPQASAESPTDETMSTNPWIKNKPS